MTTCLTSWETEILRRLAEVEAKRRGLARSEPEAFADFAKRVSRGFQFYRHCCELSAVLDRVAASEIRRLMIFMPPRHGKSLLVSRLFAAYYLIRHPERWVGLTSYAAALAFTLSHSVGEHYLAAGGKAPGARLGAEHWETTAGGGLWAAGVGGPITGRGFHLGIIDDPVKNAEEAASEVTRQRHKDWYRSTFYTREEPGGAIIIIQTRWHPDDLAGWLLAEEDGEQPERWHVLSFPAIRGEQALPLPASCVPIRDDRLPGEALCPERYPLAKLEAIRARIGSYYWSALYQQEPRPPEGNMFQRAWLPLVDAAPVEAVRVRYWDKAGTEGAGDFTAGVLMARTAEGIFYVENVVRGQWSAGNREKVIRQTAELDGHAVGVWLEQEGGSGGKDSAEATVRNLVGYNARFAPVTGDKQVRAQPFAAQAEAGNVRLVRAPWNAAYIEELISFPYGRNDDQVDASSGAFNKLSAGFAMPYFGAGRGRPA